MINDQALGDFVAARPAATAGMDTFEIKLRLDETQFLRNIPKGAELKLLDLETGEAIAELPIAGQSDGDRFQNEFGEGFSFYQKGTGFIVPLQSRTAQWWSSVSKSLEIIFAQAQAAGFDLQIAYGTLLGHVREGSFVPHDDDVDLILHCGERATPVGAALEFTRRLELIAGQGRVQKNTNGQAHVYFNFERQVSLDVFAAWSCEERYFQTFTIAGSIPESDVLPSRKETFMGTEVLFPQNPENVLAAIYGPDWKTPNPNFKWARPKETVQFFAPIHDYNPDVNKTYWNGYYTKQADHSNFHDIPPSQFAAFATSYLNKGDLIVEFGCGNGRDTLFFSTYGWDVLAGDYSQIAIEANTARAQAAGGERAKFAVCNVAETESMQRFLARTHEHQGGKRVFYSRFFLHAISGNAEESMRQMINRQANPGDLILFETRIAGDETRPKVTPEHFRRVVHGEQTILAWEALGWQREYAVSGVGFAKYKSDDALVCRFVLKKNG